MGKLINLTVKFISLVDQGANKRDIIWKSANEVYVPLKKVDDEQRMVYGIVYAPDDPDTDDDYASAETIKAAAHDFMRAGRTQQIDKQHDFNPDEGYVAESWLVRQPDALFPDEIEGAWAVGIKVLEDDTWEMVKSGDIGGISLAGFAQREQTKTKKENKPMRFFEWLKSKMETKALKDTYETRQARDLTWALSDSITTILGDDDIEDKKAAIKKDVEDYVKYLDGILEKAVKAAVVKSKTESNEKYDEVLATLKGLAGDTSKPEPSNKGEEPVDEKVIKEQGDAIKKMTSTLEGLSTKMDGLVDRVEKLEKTPGIKLSDEVHGVSKNGDNKDEKPVWLPS